MIFGWMRRQREEHLRRQNLTIDVGTLVNSAASRPKRLVLVDLGHGPEVWADYGQTTRFRKQGRIVLDAKLVLNPGEPAALASRLRLPLDRQVVRF